MLLFPYRDLPADHPSFVAINRLAAREWLPVSRQEVDFRPDAPATPEWQAAVLELSGLKTAELNLDAKTTRGAFAVRIWEMVRDRPLDQWPRTSPDDADGDGLPDLEDPLPFSSKVQSWPDDSDTPAP